METIGQFASNYYDVDLQPARRGWGWDSSFTFAITADGGLLPDVFYRKRYN